MIIRRNIGDFCGLLVAYTRLFARIMARNKADKSVDKNSGQY